MRFRAAFFASLGASIAVLIFPACGSSSSDDASNGATADASARDAIASDGAIGDAGAVDANEPVVDAGPDGGCFITTVGVYGMCMSTGDCADAGANTSTPGYCPGSADIQCCSPTPNVANNPPVPAGWKLMMQSEVTPAMTAWAVTILDHPIDYPMFSTTFQMFDTLNVMARVEWHPPDFQNETIHRGVTLYEPD